MNPDYALVCGSPEYPRLEATVMRAVRWADVKNATGWAGVMLGDAMQSCWLDKRTTGEYWEQIRETLKDYSRSITRGVMIQMVRALGDRAPIGLLGNAPDEEFIDWFNGKTFDHAQFSGGGGLSCVSSVVARIAQLWIGGRGDVAPAANTSFLELVASPTVAWPTAGIAARDKLIKLIKWESVEGSDNPMLLAPIARIVAAVIPGIHIEPWIRRQCGNHWERDSGITPFGAVISQNTRQLQAALKLLEVTPWLWIMLMTDTRSLRHRHCLCNLQKNENGERDRHISCAATSHSVCS
jgi:hypothetical protein